jgi:hypothetical protein
MHPFTSIAQRSSIPRVQPASPHPSIDPGGSALPCWFLRCSQHWCGSPRSDGWWSRPSAFGDDQPVKARPVVADWPLRLRHFGNPFGNPWPVGAMQPSNRPATTNASERRAFSSTRHRSTRQARSVWLGCALRDRMDRLAALGLVGELLIGRGKLPVAGSRGLQVACQVLKRLGAISKQHRSWRLFRHGSLPFDSKPVPHFGANAPGSIGAVD